MISTHFNQTLDTASLYRNVMPQRMAQKTSSVGFFNDFESLLSLLDPSEKSSLLTEIAQLDELQKGIDQVVDLAYSHEYQQAKEFFLSHDFELYAFAAVKEKRLFPSQFGTLMLVRAFLSKNREAKDLEVVPLFIDGAISTQAWNQIKITTEQGEENSFLDKEALACFFEKMRALPASEQSYLLVPDNRQFSAAEKTISQAVNDNVRFNVFCHLTIKGEKKRMLFSLGMAQAFLDVTGYDPLSLKFVVKPSTTESLRLSMIKDSAREFYIHTDRFPAPSMADSFYAPPLDFMYHDFYHAYTCNCIPRKHRLFYSQLASIFHPDLYEEKIAKQEAQHIYETLIDLDFTTYRPDIGNKVKEDHEAAFSALLYLMKALLPIRREVFSTSFCSEQQRQEAELVAKRLKSTLAGFFCLWILYYKDYKDFEELVKAFKSLSPDVQSKLGEDFIAVYEKVRFSLHPFLTPKKLAKFKPEEIGKIRQILNLNDFALPYLTEYVSFDEIFHLNFECQQLIISHYIFVGELFKQGITLLEISHIDKEIFFLLSEMSYLIPRWLEKGVKFSHIIELFKQWRAQGIDKSKLCCLPRLVEMDNTLENLIHLENKLPLIIDHSQHLPDLFDQGVSLTKVIKADQLKLERLFDYIENHRLCMTPYKLLTLQELLLKHPELKDMINSL